MEIQTCTAFDGTRCVAAGTLVEVVRKVKRILDQGEPKSILIFDDSTSELVEVDFRGSATDVLHRIEKMEPSETEQKGSDVQRGPGRPKLGVISREISLLPRHWEWLNAQPGGASVALRKLVEEARRIHRDRDRVRRSQEVAYRFMSAMAGNLPGFEEAARALFAGSSERFDQLTGPWPVDIRNHCRKVSGAAFRR